MSDASRIKVSLFRSSENVRAFAAGEVIFREGEPGVEMFVVRQGSVSLSIAGRVLTSLEADETFGEMALIDQAPRSATATAATPCEVVPIDRKRFLFLVQQTPNFALTMLQILAQRLRTMDAVRAQ